jgi:hypothetical protein
MHAVKRRNRVPLLLIVIVLTVGGAGVWTFVARQQLASAIVGEASEHLDNAHKAFGVAIARQQADLMSHCRVLVEDPRLKSTLATQGIDEATVADILDDLARLRGSGFLLVLSPEARVFAQSGAAELRGLDLSDSSVVKQARAAATAVVGSWVLAGRVMDLSIMAIRYGEEIIGFLVVGQAIDAPILQSVTEQTGVHAANALANNLVQASSSEPHINAVLAQVARDGAQRSGRVVTVNGATYVVGVVQLDDSALSHRLVLARPIVTVAAQFAPFGWFLFVPPLLVLIAVLFSRSVFRRTP